MVGAPDVVKPSEKVDDQSPYVNGKDNPVYIISDETGTGDSTYIMSSVNSSNGDLKSLRDPPDKKITEEDTEKQPLSGKKEERWWTTLMQVAVPFFIAGCGTIGAGLVLGTVRDWDVFVNVSAIFVLVPSLSGLKGNLDMCLASRLSTQANLGNMESMREVVSMVVGNISLVQVQAIVAATVVSIFAIVVNSITDRTINGSYVLLIIASAVFTATTTCFVLDFVMVMVIYGSHKFKVNPDNVATPLAASIGDIVSNTVLAVTAQYMYEQIQSSLWQPITLICVYYCLLPLWVFVVWRNRYTKVVLTSGWTPVISALFISGIGGIVLDQAVDRYRGYEVFQPIVNGIGGNLVCVQSSRMATHLHQTAIPGELPEGTKLMEWPWRTLFFGTSAAKVARMLLVLAVFGQIIFMVVADFVYQGVVSLQFAFGITYLACSLLQVMVLLYLAYILVHFMWKKKKDPDNAAIPYLTALGDLLGSVFLGLAFVILSIFGMGYESSLWQPITLICVYYCLLPLWVFVVWRNRYTKVVLTSGWTPVISALFISGIGGIVLDQAVDRYRGYEVFQPIVNGIGGNLVCVQSSRMATHLHQTAIPGELPEGTKLMEWPWRTLFFGTSAAKVARMLLVLAVFGQIIFMVVADFVYQGVVSLQFAFGITYLACSLLQVMVLLYLAYILVHFMWKKKKDPDNAAIPYLTALGDLLGSVFLGLAFVILSIFGMGYGNNVE